MPSIPRLTKMAPEVMKDIKIGKLTDISLGCKFNRIKKQLRKNPEAFAQKHPQLKSLIEKSDDFIADNFAQVEKRADDISVNNPKLYDFINNAPKLIKDSKLKIKVFSNIPFISKVKVKFIHLEENGKKVIKQTDLIKFRAKELFKKPAKTIEASLNKFIDFMTNVFNKSKEAVENTMSSFDYCI